MKVTALVVDDEQLARDELCFLLGQSPDVEVIGQAGDGIEALGLLEDLEPDLVFLDIQMPGLTGFEVAQQAVARKLVPEFVFVTAYDQYALDAFHVNAVDYLLKPVDAARLERALTRARRRMTATDRLNGVPGADLERIVQLVSERQTRRAQVAVRMDERILLLPADDLVYASLNDDVVTVVATGAAGTATTRTLDELQAQLDPAIFWRVHRSYLVNIHKIKEIVPWFSRNFILRMKDAKATEIPVSRTQTKRLREYLKL
jgi:two-component system LytT family response regulator/two-component system response regulator LytT